MNLKNRPPIFVPSAHIAEIEKLSKAFLMDLVWDYAACGVVKDDDAAIMAELRVRRDIIQIHRDQEFGK